MGNLLEGSIEITATNPLLNLDENQMKGVNTTEIIAHERSAIAVERSICLGHNNPMSLFG